MNIEKEYLVSGLILKEKDGLKLYRQNENRYKRVARLFLEL